MIPESLTSLFVQNNVLVSEMAELCGVKPTYIRSCLHGMRAPNLKVAQLMAKRLNVTVDELLMIGGWDIAAEA